MATTNELFLKVVTDLEDVKKDLKSLGLEFQTFSNVAKEKVSSISAKFMQFGLVMQGVQSGMMIAQKGFDAMISPYAELQEAMLGVQKTTGMTNDELKILEGRLVQLSHKTGQSALDLAKMSEIAGQLGIQGVKNISDFTQTISMLKKTTDLGVEESAERMAQLANIFDQPISKVERLGDVINDLSNSTSAGARDIVDGVRRIGTAGKELGFGFADIAAISATLKEMGIDAEKGGTAIKTALIRMQNQSKKIAQHMGITEEKWNKMLTNDGKGALLAYLQTLDKMDQISRSKSIFKVFGQEGYLAISSLSGATGDLIKNIERANHQFEVGGSLQAEFSNMMQGMNAQAARFWQVIKSFSFELGSKFVPYLTQGFKFLADNLKYTGDAIRFIWGYSKPFFAAVAGYYSVVGAGVVIQKSWLIMKKLQVLWTNRASIAQRKLNWAMSANPIGLVIKILGALVGAFMATGGNMEKFKLIWEALAATVHDAMTNIGSIVSLVFHGFTFPLRFAINMVFEFAKSFKQIFGSLGDIVKGFWKIMTGDFDEGWEQMKSGVNDLGKTLKDGLSDALKETIDPIAEAYEDLDMSKSKEAWSKAGKQMYEEFQFSIDEAAAENPPEIPESKYTGDDINLDQGTESIKQFGFTLSDMTNSAQSMFTSLGGGIDGVSRVFKSTLGKMSEAFLEYVWTNFVMKKAVSELEKVEDRKNTVESLANSAARTTAATVETGVEVTKSTAKFPFPMNLILAAGGLVTLMGILGSFKSKAKSVAAFARGGVATEPVLAGNMLFGEAGIELFAPQKDFLTYAKETLTPMIRKDTINQAGPAPAQVHTMDTKVLESKIDGLKQAVLSRPAPTAREIGREIHLNNRGSM